MINFLIAIQFLTIAPPLIKRIFTPEEMGRATGFYPLVGALIGGILLAVNYALSPILPGSMRAVLVLGVWVLLTGALHLDGLLDSFDGIFGGFTPEQRLEIMHDERVGAFGFAGGALHMLLKYTALTILVGQPAVYLLLPPILGRWGMAVAIFAFPYARKKGLGSDIKAHTGRPELILATVVALVSSFLIAQWAGLIIMAAAGLLVWGAGSYITKRIPGLTGDSYGAFCEIIEAVSLLGLVIWTTI